MVGRSLPIWAYIVLFGAVLLAIIGFINPYVPKDQKKKAKELSFNGTCHDYRIIISSRVKIPRIWYVVMSTALTIAATVFFIIEDYANLVRYVGGGFFGTLVAILFIILGAFLLDVCLFAVMCICEEITARDEREYYIRRYGAELVSEDELELYKDSLRTLR